jgi:3-oxoacyl-[acyl-carrier protein] reductase
MDLELTDRVALVTGSSRGIGYAIASRLREEGCRVVLNSRNLTELKQSAAQLQVPFLVGDVQDAAEAKRIVGECQELYGALDILVCNVGSGSSVPPGQETEDEWLRVMRLNLGATTNTVTAARHYMQNRSGAAILCISSICGCEALGAPIAYSAAKAALNSFVIGSSRYLSKEGIRINALAPGNILFEGSTWERKLGEDQSSVASMLQREVALGRLGTPQEVADMACFLCSPLAGFATGAVYVLDGGQLRH